MEKKREAMPFVLGMEVSHVADKQQNDWEKTGFTERGLGKKCREKGWGERKRYSE